MLLVVMVVLLVMVVSDVLVMAGHARRVFVLVAGRRRRTVVRLRQYRVLELSGQVAGTVLSTHRFEHSHADTPVYQTEINIAKRSV